MSKYDKWYRVHLEGSFYDDMVGALISEEPCSVRLWFGINIGSAKFIKKYIKEEDMFN